MFKNNNKYIGKIYIYFFKFKILIELLEIKIYIYKNIILLFI